jgi:RHS repeat-associated protein
VFPTTYSFDYAYESARPHAPTHIGDDRYQYDADGNQTGAADDFGGAHRNTVWDDEDRITSLAQNGGWQSYLYDDRGDRMVRVGSQGKTVYVNEYMTLTNGAFAVKHVFAGATRVASKRMVQGQQPPPSPSDRREDDQVFFHQDHNGNVAFTTNAAGALTGHNEYFPFGETWIQENAGPEPSPYHFVGKEQDPVTGLYAFGARYYDARTSAWMSVDPFDGLGSPFGYAGANPLAFIDPDGRDPKQVSYGSKFAAKARQYRLANPGTKGRNVATVAYVEIGANGKKSRMKYHTMESKGRHTEGLLHDFLSEEFPDGEGVEVKWFYTELAPCGCDYRHCSKLLRTKYPRAKVYYSFDYSASSRVSLVSSKTGLGRTDKQRSDTAKIRRRRASAVLRAANKDLQAGEIFDPDNHPMMTKSLPILSSDEEMSDGEDDDE